MAPHKESRKKKAVKKSAERKKRATPRFIAPELARLALEPPVGREWIHEVKFDGYRTLARISDGSATLFTRSGLNWTKKYGDLARELANLPLDSAWIDGEIAVTDSRGLTQFHALQVALKSRKVDSLVYYVFDLLELNGEDLRELPLEERKTKLAALVKRAHSRSILYSDHWSGSGKELLKKGCAIGLEGIISKDRGSAYVSGRGASWIKTKCVNTEEFVVCGYVESDARMGVRSLLLGTRRRGKLSYVGRVGTGFDRSDLRELSAKFRRLRTTRSPFSEKVSREADVRWLRPKLVAQIKFRGWTADRRLRHASFQGIRPRNPG